MAIKESIIEFAATVRSDRAANPRIGGDGTALELLIAPRFRTLVEAALGELTPLPPTVLPEYERRGLGRPDLAFVRQGNLARAFIELKEPRKSLAPSELRGHDADQFRRFSELPLWGYCNFLTFKLYQRANLIDEAEIAPAAALEPNTAATVAERLIRQIDHSAFERVLSALANAQPPSPKNAREIAETLGHSARLVREIVVAQCAAGLDDTVTNVKADFNQTLFSRAEAGGYNPLDGDALFASAFAQTLTFGLLLAREASGREVGLNAHESLPQATYPLLRGTLRALTMEEVRNMLGVAFDVVLDSVNAVNPEHLLPQQGRDPLLYLYEDFLRIFDPSAVAKYGVYYTPPEIVQLVVTETDQALRNGLHVDGMMDPNVNLLDPACGTGTFLISAVSSVARQARAQFGEGAIGPEVTAFARRMHGFELLVGPYTVAHYRMLREVLGHNGTAERLPIFLTDTLAPPSTAAGVEPHLAFLSAPMVDERRHADDVKRQGPILAIMGNPPYKRLRANEVARLVGADMNARWEDMKRPVRDAGMGRSLNAFPDLYVAFYRWSLWKLFESEGALQRGILSFITNRGFLAGTGFGGMRQMLRQRFDHIRIIDLRGDNRGALPATVATDENVFNIEVGVCILVAYATGNKAADVEATVEYADIWQAGAFTRPEKLELATKLADGTAQLTFRPLPGNGMTNFTPKGFAETNWPCVADLFTFKSNGIVTYRDGFSYALSIEAIETRIFNWHALTAQQAAAEFGETRDRKSGPAFATTFHRGSIERVVYRPFDQRFLYNRREFIDFPRTDLQNAWGAQNIALFCLSAGTGAGPAVWCHGHKPDQHSFSGRGGWVFPLVNHAGEGRGHFLSPHVIPGLSGAYGFEVAPQQVFDCVLALLSARSYTTRFAFDLQDGFPHVPFPADPQLFLKAVEIGSRIRQLETQTEQAAPEFRLATLTGRASQPTLAIPQPRRAFIADGNTGHIHLLADASLRIANVSRRAWKFAISGYPVIYNWIKRRDGETIDANLQRALLALIWSVEELLQQFDLGDAVLAKCLNNPLVREQVGVLNANDQPIEDDEI